MHFEISRGEQFMPKQLTKTNGKCKILSFFFYNFASSTAMGPTLVPLDPFLIKCPKGMFPDERCAVLSSLFRRRGVQFARLDFSKKQITYKSPIYLPVTIFAKHHRLVQYYLGRFVLLNLINKCFLVCRVL